MHVLSRLRVGLLLLLVFSISFSLCPIVHADVSDILVDTGCGAPDMPYYTSAVNPAKDTYDVYVKLGKVGQVADVSGYVRFDDGSTNCVDIGATKASGDEWRKLGSYTDIEGDASTVLQLSSNVFKDVPNANRPTLMLVSQSNPVCVPTTQCETTYQGQKVYITPTGQPTREYALNIVEAKSLENDTVKKVEYYADNERLYETKQLETFDTSLAPSYANKLYRVIYFDSGQKAISEQTAELHMDSFGAFMTRIYERYEPTIWVIIAALGIVGILYAVRGAINVMSRRRMWRQAHGLEQAAPETMFSDKHIGAIVRRDKIIKIISRIGLVIGSAAVVVLVLSQFVVMIGTVDGHSMDTSFHDGEKIIVNKLPVTFANMNGNAYTPKRGEVVIVYPNFGTNLADDSIENSETIIKRVIGLPGERVVVDNGKLTVYNDEHKDGFDPSAGTTWASHVQTDDSTDYIDVTLDKNQIFLCGDNRPVSIDSRFNGPIATSQIVGIVN